MSEPAPIKARYEIVPLRSSGRTIAILEAGYQDAAPDQRPPIVPVRVEWL